MISLSAELQGFCTTMKRKKSGFHDAATLRSWAPGGRLRGRGGCPSALFIYWLSLFSSTPPCGAGRCVCACGWEDRVEEGPSAPSAERATLPPGAVARTARPEQQQQKQHRLREQVTHCRYKPANQKLAQRSSAYPSPPRCSSAPQSSASQARFPRPSNGLPGKEAHLRHPFPCSPLSLAWSAK